MPDTTEEEYEFITAVVDCGTLYWEYQVKGRKACRLNHDEDVGDWSDADIIRVTIHTLDVPSHQHSLIRVEYA